MMKRIQLLSALILLVSVSLSAQVFDKFAATVNLVKPDAISVRQLEARIQMILAARSQAGLPAVPVTKQDKLSVLEGMISEKLVEQGMEQSGITVSQSEIDAAIENQKAALEQQNGVRITLDQFKNAVISQAKISWDEYIEEIRSQLQQQKYISQKRGDYIRTNLKTPTDEEIEDFYADNRSEFTNPDILRYRQIYLSTINKSSAETDDLLKKAEMIYQKYQDGDMSFDDLVKEYTDDARAKMSGGDAGFLARNDANAKAYLGETFLRDIFRVPVGEVKGVLKSNIGYHIVRVTERREARILNLQDTIAPNTATTVRDFIASQLFQQQQQIVLAMAIEDLVVELKKDAEITIFSENLE